MGINDDTLQKSAMCELVTFNLNFFIGKNKVAFRNTVELK